MELDGDICGEEVAVVGSIEGTPESTSMAMAWVSRNHSQKFGCLVRTGTLAVSGVDNIVGGNRRGLVEDRLMECTSLQAHNLLESRQRLDETDWCHGKSRVWWDRIKENMYSSVRNKVLRSV